MSTTFKAYLTDSHWEIPENQISKLEECVSLDWSKVKIVKNPKCFSNPEKKQFTYSKISDSIQVRSHIHNGILHTCYTDVTPPTIITTTTTKEGNIKHHFTNSAGSISFSYETKNKI